jgi:hypothetical protein
MRSTRSCDFGEDGSIGRDAKANGTSQTASPERDDAFPSPAA